MSTSMDNWLKLILLILLLSISAAIGRNHETPYQTHDVWNILLLCLMWLSIGSLVRCLPSTEQSEKFLVAVWRILLGWGILWLVWYLPVWFPGLKLNDYGFELDLQKSPAVFWMAVAFILGFYRNLPFKIPVVVWNQIKKSTGIKEDPDLHGNAKYRFLSYWNGLKSILEDISHFPSSS